jgi:16S rRNA (uracil1498-N3)-methyltransferase
MRVPRIYTPQALSTGLSLTLESAASSHLCRVLRLHAGAALTLFDGRGGEYAAILRHADARGCVAGIGEHHAIERESVLDIELAQGISRGERMDFVIQKAVELGVNRIVPLTSARSQVRLSGARLEQRVNHWRGIVIGACEQCGRNRLAEVAVPLSLDAWLETLGMEDARFVLSPDAPLALPRQPPSTARVHLLIGPEGGLAPQECAMAGRAGFVPLRLGPRVLRTETATLAALAALQSAWGDMT